MCLDSGQFQVSAIGGKPRLEFEMVAISSDRSFYAVTAV
jgi:hypothetical protein